MAVDVCSEIASISASPSLCPSPRLSFSRDRSETDPKRLDPSLLDRVFDFDFSIDDTRFNQELPSADELFSNGKILPIEINKTIATTTRKTTPKKTHPEMIGTHTFYTHPDTHTYKHGGPTRTNPCMGPHACECVCPDMCKKCVSVSLLKTHHSKTIVFPTRPSTITRSASKNVIEESEKKRLIELLSMEFEEEEEAKQPISKSFWQFRRSTSLNCDNGHSASLIRSLQFLSRSHSTGSAPNPKRRVVSKYTQKQNSFKEPPAAAFSPPSHYGYYPYNSSKRPPRKKNYTRSYSDGVRVSPVLNISPSCMAGGSASLFGIGSLICMGKAKKKK